MTHVPHHIYNLSAIPLGRGEEGKEPCEPTWMERQQRIIPILDPSVQYIGIVLGAVSGNLECIDYDVKHDDTKGSKWEQYKEIVTSTMPALWDKLYIEASPTGGRHILYRCEEIEIPNKKRLARNKRGNAAFFERLGKGNYVVVAPSPNYTQLSTVDLTQIPTLSHDERDLLSVAAESISDYEQPAQVEHNHDNSNTDYVGGLSPFDDYDRRGDVHALLRQHGWRVHLTTRNNVIHYTRPGKERGTSATWNHYPNRFHVFTSSTILDCGKSYKPSQLYALLTHNGNFKAAAQELARSGYGYRGSLPAQKRIATEPTPTDNHVSTQQVIASAFAYQRGDSHLLNALLNKSAVYVAEEKQWYIFQHKTKPHHWTDDRTNWLLSYSADALIKAYKNTRDIVAGERDEATNTYIASLATNADETARKKATQSEVVINALSSRIKSCSSEGHIKGVLSLCASDNGVTSDLWDTDPMLLGVGNGTLDLATCTLRPSKQQDYIRRTTNTPYNPKAQAPRFIQFFREIHDDEETANYMHKFLGYSLTGLTTEHTLPILYGALGRNGKDTLLNTIGSVLESSIAKPIHQDTIILAGKRAAEQATPSITDLQGLRLGWVNEIDEGAQFNIARLKALSGGGDISSRAVYGRELTAFKQSCKILLVTNTKPTTLSYDEALWARLALVNYTTRFVDKSESDLLPNEKQIDKNLLPKLLLEKEGILAWLVQGLQKWKQEGLRPSAKMKNEAETYRRDLDTVSEWLQECTQFISGMQTKTVEAFASWSKWCTERGLYSRNNRWLTARLEEKGYPRMHTRNGNVYDNLTIVKSYEYMGGPF